jgi:hypothetical protein
MNFLAMRSVIRGRFRRAKHAVEKDYIADDDPGRYDSAVSLAEIKQLASQLPPEELTALTSFLVSLTQNSEFNGALLSESVLRRAWNSPEEDTAWENL